MLGYQERWDEFKELFANILRVAVNPKRGPRFNKCGIHDNHIECGYFIYISDAPFRLSQEEVGEAWTPREVLDLPILGYVCLTECYKETSQIAQRGINATARKLLSEEQIHVAPLLTAFACMCGRTLNPSAERLAIPLPLPAMRKLLTTESFKRDFCVESNGNRGFQLSVEAGINYLKNCCGKIPS
jgi:hypothetical protein